MLNQNKLFQATVTDKLHFKMYKAGKRWLVAGISLLFAGALAIAKPNDTAAATTTDTEDAAPTTVQTQPNADANTTKSGMVLTTAQAAAKADADQAAQSAKTPAPVVQETAVKTVTSDAAAKDTNAAPVAAATDKQQSAQTTNNDQQAAADATQNQPAATKQADESVTPATTTDTKTQPATVATTTQNDATQQQTTTTPAKAATTTADTADTADTKNDSKQAVVEADLGDASASEIEAVKAAAKAAYLATGQAQKVTAVSPGATATEDATMTLSTDKVGYMTNQTSLKITYTMLNAEAGDVYTINLPADNMVMLYGGVNSLATALGTTTMVKNSDRTRTITNTFTNSPAGVGGIVQTITYNLQKNGNGSLDYYPVAQVGTQTHDIRWNITKQQSDGTSVVVKNGATSVDTVVNPSVNLAPVARTNPNSSIPAILPNTNYVYDFSVNESDGVFNDGRSTAQVDKVINYGTTITIPVPTGFTLDATTTSQLNDFSGNGQTIISQDGGAGHDIIITVPSGKGRDADGTPYKLAGSFNTPQADDTTTLSASGPITFSQKLNDGAQTLTAAGPTWTEQLLGSKVDPNLATDAITIYGMTGNSSNAQNKLVLDQDPSNDPKTLLSTTFSYQSPSAASDAHIVMTMPDGFDVNAVSVPIEGVSTKQYLPGTTSYAYVMTLADGTTQTGTVAAGDKATTNTASPIRKIVFTPNTLAPGAATDSTNKPGSFQFYGKLASQYDDGTPVKVNDKLTATMDVTFDGDTNDSKNASTYDQTVVTPVSHAEALGAGGADPAKPGSTNHNFSMYTNGDFSQTTNMIYEPIVYYILPIVAAPTSVIHVQNAKVTESVIPDGRVLVKIDYTGTGESITIGTSHSENPTVMFANNPDALPGSYPYGAYIYSPNTALQETTKVTDTTLTDGNPDAVLMSGGNKTWKIDTASSTYTTTLAQGDDIVPVAKATTNQNSTKPVSFITNIVNTQGAYAGGATVVLNLPDVGDDRNSDYTFEMTGAATVPTDFTTGDGSTQALNADVTYATTRAPLTAGSTTADLTGYVGATQVTDWTKVRSVKITLPSLPKDVSTGRIVLTGNIPGKKEGQVGTIETAFYLPNTPVAVNKAENDASIKVIGTSTINARVHYTAADGTDEYDALPVLDKTYVDNTDTVKLTDFPATLPDTYVMPAGYELAPDSLHFVEGGSNATAADNKLAVADFNGDYAQYELIPQLEYGTATTTRQVVYAVDGGTASAPAPVVQKVDWKTTTNMVTGETVSTPQAVYYKVASPDLTGYMVDQDYAPETPLQAITGLPTNAADVNITYVFNNGVTATDPHVYTKVQVPGAIGWKTQVPEAVSVKSKDYYEHKIPDEGIWVRTRIPEAVSVTTKDYYEHKIPDEGIWVKARVPEAVSVTTKDYYEHKIPDEGIWVKTRVPEGAKVTTKDYYEHKIPDEGIWVKTRVPEGSSVTPDQYYDLTKPGEPGDGIQVRMKVPDSPSVTPDQYYDFTKPGEPGDGIKVRTQIPDGASVTTKDYYEHKIPDEGIWVKTQIPEGASVTTKDYYEHKIPDEGIWVKTRVPEGSSVTPDNYYDWTKPGEPGDGIQVRVQVPTGESVTPDQYYDNTQPPADGGNQPGLPNTFGDGNTPDNNPAVPTTGDNTPTDQPGLPDTFGGNTDDNTPAGHQGLPDTFGGSQTDGTTQSVATGNTSTTQTMKDRVAQGNQQTAKNLPQTGDGTDMGLVALGIAFLAGLLGLAGMQHKEH